MAAADAAITSCDFKPISLGIRAKGYGFKAALMASKEPSPRLHPIAPITPTFPVLLTCLLQSYTNQKFTLPNRYSTIPAAIAKSYPSPRSSPRRPQL
jgi:hypothetical protein